MARARSRLTPAWCDLPRAALLERRKFQTEGIDGRMVVENDGQRMAEAARIVAAFQLLIAVENLLHIIDVSGCRFRPQSGLKVGGASRRVTGEAAPAGFLHRLAERGVDARLEDTNAGKGRGVHTTPSGS